MWGVEGNENREVGDVVIDDHGSIHDYLGTPSFSYVEDMDERLRSQPTLSQVARESEKIQSFLFGDVSLPLSQSQPPFELTDPHIQRFIAGCDDKPARGKWPKKDFSFDAFCHTNLISEDGKTIMTPALRKTTGGIAILPLYAFYVVHSLKSGGQPVHRSKFVALLARKYSLASDQEENGPANGGSRKSQDNRMAFGDRHPRFTDENLETLLAMIAPSNQNARMLQFLTDSREESGHRIGLIKNLFYDESVSLCDDTLSLLWALRATFKVAEKVISKFLLVKVFIIFFDAASEETETGRQSCGPRPSSSPLHDIA